METCDVVVIGSGLAGLSAVIEASKSGKSIVLLEKDMRGGGNSSKASSGISCSSTHVQLTNKIEDNNDLYKGDILTSGQGLSKKEIVEVGVDNSASAIEFLDSFGVHLSRLIRCGGHSVARTHRFALDENGKCPPVGFTIVSTLRKEVEKCPNVKILCGCSVTDIIVNDKVVSGVEYIVNNAKTVLNCNSVVLASGGYGNDHTETSLLKEFVPHLADYPTTNGPFATGDILKICRKFGVQLTLMDQVQVHPTGFVDPNDVNNYTKFLAPEALRGVGGILVNQEGKRFINELDRRDIVTNGILNNCSKISINNTTTNNPSSYIIMSESMCTSIGKGDVGFYCMKGFLNKCGSIAEICEKTKIPVDVLSKTIQEYNESIKRGSDEFGKKNFPNDIPINENLYYGVITPSIHYTMGGVQINPKCQVIHQDGTPIKGLYGAGEVTGGLHGANRLAGASLMECVVFGRIAGTNASIN